MQFAEPARAPLTAAMIRRPLPPAATEPVASVEQPAHRGWRDDLRLFAITWAAGFVFFLAFIA